MNGLSTLNRLLGKRNKDVSKSTSNLSRSTTNLDTSSQYNKIVPLAAMTNAPFEQTFRITVLLPRDQLYVARIGAKTRLSALMDMICTDKQLDAQKYLFRHPSDFHQGFELDLTIGEVGLNEIRLVSKKELENLQNNEYRLSTSDIFRLHQKNIRESSVSSSDLSRTSRVALKTTSPYSSTNSLNSMDSSGLSSSSRGGVNGNQHHPPVAPMRKKRVAPRPPSQNSIPEKGPLETPKADPIFKEPQLPPYSKKNFHVSSPNLFNRDLKPVDVTNNNNNEYNGTDELVVETVEEMHNIINTKTSYSTLKNRPTSMYIIREPPENNNNNHNGNPPCDLDIVNHSRTSSNSSEVKDPRDFQDPGPQRPTTPSRKRLDSNAAKKAKPPAPAPPPRGVSLGTLKAPTQPIVEPKIVPTPSPRAPVRSTADAARDNETVISESTDSNYSEADELQRNRETVSKLNAVNSTHQPATPPQQNVSKVMLNVDHNSQPSSLSPEVERKPPTNGASSVSIKIVKEDEPTAVTNGHLESSKPTTPIQVSKVHIVPPTEQDVSVDEREESIDRRLSNGHSSDEDIKIYNIESGKEMRIPDKKDPPIVARSPSPEEEEQWTYTLPAPPKFADSSIKSGEYDEKQRYFDLQSTFVDNTTFVTDRVTVHSDETERIQPIIREKVLLDESLGEVETEKCPSPTVTLNESEAGGEVLINSDIEDGYRGGSELRETMLQTLEKRREKLKESELQELKESIEGVISPVSPPPETPEVPNESDIMKCAKLNEETVVDDYTVVVQRSQSVVETKRVEVINELAQVIRDENGLKGMLNGKTEEDDREEVIAGVNQNNLSNFKIATYNGVHKEGVVVAAPADEKPVSAPTLQKSDDSEEDSSSDVVVRRKISADSLLRSKLPSSDEEESRTFQNGISSKKDSSGGPVKRRSLTVLNKSPKAVNRSDSFHSTRSDYIQSLASGVASNGLRLTPRSTSYISLIGAQKFENRFAQSSRRKSTSEMSICDSPSLQSLEVIKNILNTSRSNLGAAAGGEEIGQEMVPMAAIKRNSFTDISTLVQFKSEIVRSGLARRESLVERKIEEVEAGKKVEEDEEELQPEKVEMIEELVSTKISEKIAPLEPVFDVSNESKSDDEKLQNKQLTATVVKQPQTSVVNITTTSTTVAHSGVTVNGGQNGAVNEKKWKYQGPPTINLTTWSERPKIDVSIKSDRDYRFGGSSTLPRGYRNVNNTTKININAPTASDNDRDDGHDCPDSREQVPLSSGEAQSFSLPQEVNRLEPVSITSTDRLPIVRAVEYKKNIVPPPAVAQKPEKSFFYETFSRTPTTTTVPSGTATINRLSLGGYQKFQPVVRGFKSMDDQPPPQRRPVSMIESANISTAILRTTPVRVEKPAPETTSSLPFGQNTLRRTGLKDKILAQPSVEPAKVTPPPPPPPVIVPLKAVPTTVAPPPPPPKMTTPVVRAAIVKKPLPPAQVDPRSALLDAIRSFNKDKLRKEVAE